MYILNIKYLYIFCIPCAFCVLSYLALHWKCIKISSLIITSRWCIWETSFQILLYLRIFDRINKTFDWKRHGSFRQIVTLAVISAVLCHFTIRHRLGGNEEAGVSWAWWSLVYGGRIRPAVPSHLQKSTVYLITGNERACKRAGIETRGKLRSHLIGLCIGPAFVSRTCKRIVNDRRFWRTRELMETLDALDPCFFRIFAQPPI